MTNKYVKLSNNHWFCIYAKISPKSKKVLRRYFSSIYPRDYVRKLIAELDNVQFKQT